MDDAYVEEELMMMTSHLLCHSDSECYYIPVDFQDVIFDDTLPGEHLGTPTNQEATLPSLTPFATERFLLLLQIVVNCFNSKEILSLIHI